MNGGIGRHGGERYFGEGFNPPAPCKGEKGSVAKCGCIGRMLLLGDKKGGRCGSEMFGLLCDGRGAVEV